MFRHNEVSVWLRNGLLAFSAFLFVHLSFSPYFIELFVVVFFFLFFFFFCFVFFVGGGGVGGGGSFFFFFFSVLFWLAPVSSDKTFILIILFDTST